MKKRSLLLAAIVVSLVLTGCGKRSGEKESVTEVQTETQSETETETQTEKQTETETEKQTETETEKESSMNKTRTVKGLVKSSDTSKLKIQTERGKEIEFSVTGADIQVAGGIATGSTVNVIYKGTITDSDASAAKVLMVKDIDAGETAVTEGEPMTEAAEADPYAGAGAIGGTLEDLDTARVVVRADDGDAFYFSTFGSNINLVNGIQKGNYVTINYDGDIYGPDVVTAISISDNGDGEEHALYGPEQEGEYTYINGSLIDCGLGSVTILTDDEEKLEFDVKDASFGYYNGLVYGNYITLECEGTLEGTDTSKLKVLSVYDYEDNSLFAESSDDEYSEEEYSDDEYSDDEYYEEEYYDEGAEEYYEE